jgi:hypothetical protein
MFPPPRSQDYKREKPGNEVDVSPVSTPEFQLAYSIDDYMCLIFSEMVPDEVKRELLEKIRSYFGDNV